MKSLPAAGRLPWRGKKRGVTKMKKLIFLSLFIPALLFSQWTEQTIPSGVGVLLTIDFADSTTGVAAGYKIVSQPEGRAIYTTNGGVDWYLAQLPDSSRSFLTVQLLNSTTGYCAGASNISGDYLSTDTRGMFIKTTNSGHTWFSYGNLPQGIYYLYGMYFVDLSTGYISAQNNPNQTSGETIYKTTNGGLSWILSYSDPGTLGLENIYFINNSTGFAVGKASTNDTVYSSQGLIIKTTNSGVNWSRQLFYNMSTFTDISMINSTTGFACGGSNPSVIIRGTIYKTTNTGQNWVKLNFQLEPARFGGIEFLPSSGTGICFGEKYDSLHICEKTIISKTTDYGNNWQTYYMENSQFFNSESNMLSSTNWYICGGTFATARILHTTNGGAIGIEPISSEIPNQFSLSQNYPNPFNPSTKIKFDLPAVGQRHAFDVRLIIYDVLGREIATLVNEELNPGMYEVTWDASSYPSGVYFYKLVTQDFSETKKMVLIK